MHRGRRSGYVVSCCITSGCLGWPLLHHHDLLHAQQQTTDSLHCHVLTSHVCGRMSTVKYSWKTKHSSHPQNQLRNKNISLFLDTAHWIYFATKTTFNFPSFRVPLYAAGQWLPSSNNFYTNFQKLLSTEAFCLIQAIFPELLLVKPGPPMVTLWEYNFLQARWPS